MKSNIIIFLLVQTTFVFAGANAFLKAGFNRADIRTTQSEPQYGPSYGAGIDFQLNEKLYLGVEVLISERSAVLRDKIIGGRPMEEIKKYDLYCSINYRQVPVLLKYECYQYKKFRMRIYGGLDFSWAHEDKSYTLSEQYLGDVGDDTEWQNTRYDYLYVPERNEILSERIYSSGLAYTAGFSVHWRMLFFDVRYLYDRHYLHTLDFPPLAEVKEKMHSLHVYCGIEFLL